MSLQQIDIPESSKRIPLSQPAASLIDVANDRIEAFMLADQTVIEDFVPCDFELLDQSLAWITQHRLLTGNRFCELGSGFGTATMLAAIHGMESVGIEIESVLVAQSRAMAADLNVVVRFLHGSYLPRDHEFAADPKLAPTDECDVYEEFGLAMSDFDLFFAFPWPKERDFLEAVFDAHAADGALLLTYREREGMNLVRKT